MSYGLFAHMATKRSLPQNSFGAPFGRGPLVLELRCPKLRYATG